MMAWDKVFDLPCECKRVPEGGVLVQRWSDICPMHQAEAVPETTVQAQIRGDILVQQELQAMARERLQAKT